MFEREAFSTCHKCTRYAIRREPVLVPAIAFYSSYNDEPSRTTLVRLMRGVHARHLSGLSILPGEVVR